ncbi:MAG: hypothetical protein ACR2QO_24860 [Acidimicrobiales bacterium]
MRATNVQRLCPLSDRSGAVANLRRCFRQRRRIAAATAAVPDHMFLA